MKELKRGIYPSIIKREITLNHTVSYHDLDLEMISHVLNEVITNYTYSTIDLLQLLKEHYQSNLMNTIYQIKDYSNVRFNCYYATTLLKEKLKERGIHSHIISFKSIGFSTSYGDQLIREAHMALLLPTMKNQRLYYIILDPGLRIPTPLGFYADVNKTILSVDQDEIIIEKTGREDYPYTMKIKGYNRYSILPICYQAQEFFDVRYETLNPVDVLFPISYHILDGYRIIHYSIQPNSWAVIKIMMIEKYLECNDNLRHIKITFAELETGKRNDLIQLLEPFTNKLGVDIEELVDIILFTLAHHQEFLESVIDQNVLLEKEERNPVYIKTKN